MYGSSARGGRVSNSDQCGQLLFSLWVFHSLPWSRLQLLQSVLNSAARLIRGLWWFDHNILHRFLLTCTGYRTPSVRIAYFLQDLSAYVQVFERLGPCLSFCSCCGSKCVESCSSRWSRCAGTQDRVGSWSFVVAGPKCWNKLPVGLRDLSVGPETLAKHLKTHLFRAGFFLTRHSLLSLYYIL